jgi:hypothetical protein
MLISAIAPSLALPVPVATGVDDPLIRKRAERIARRAADAIVDQVQELADLGLVKSANVEVRTHNLGPNFKLYIFNGHEVFFSFYPVVQREISLKGEPTEIFDLLGRDVTLFHYAIDDDETSHATQFVESARMWFDSVWNTIAREYHS